jgi:hypothetical protein
MKTFAGIFPKIDPYCILVRRRDIDVQQRGYAVVYDDKIFVKPVQHAFCNGKKQTTINKKQKTKKEQQRNIKHVRHVS